MICKCFFFDLSILLLSLTHRLGCLCLWFQPSLDSCRSTAPSTNEEASAEILIEQFGSYKVKTVGWTSLSLTLSNAVSYSGPHSHAHLVLSSSPGWVNSAICSKNFPNWLTIWGISSDRRQSVGASIRQIALFLSGFARILWWSMTWPRNFAVDLWNSHFEGCEWHWRLEYAREPLSIFERHTTLSSPFKILLILFWNRPGALKIPNGSLLSAYLPKGVIKVVSTFDTSDRGICQNPLLASNLLKNAAPVSCASVSSTLGMGCISRRTLLFSDFGSTQIGLHSWLVMYRHATIPFLLSLKGAGLPDYLISLPVSSVSMLHAGL